MLSGDYHNENGFTELDDASVLAYRHAVRLGRFSAEALSTELKLDTADIDRIERVLRNLRLIHPMPGFPDILVPVGPATATSELVGPTEEQIRNLQFAVMEIRTRLMSLAPTYFEDRRERNRVEAFDVISDVSMVQAMLNDYAHRCTSELMTVQPGGARPAALLSAVRSPLSAALERGVKMRTIYQHPARSDLATRAYVADATALGAEIRTTDEVIDRMIIYDHEVAFLPERNVVGRAPGAVIVREPTLVGYLCAVLEHLWNSAMPFNPNTEVSDSINEDMKLAIIRLMAKGFKDEMIARRLGMSVRTCRRHIAEIMEKFETSSRFQAGVEITRAGLLDTLAHDE